MKYTNIVGNGVATLITVTAYAALVGYVIGVAYVVFGIGVNGLGS